MGVKIPKIIYNHGLIYDPDTDLIYEADFPKVVAIKRSEWESKKKNKTAIIKRVKLNLTSRQKSIILTYLQEQIGKKYELINFWWHLVKIVTNKWYGSTTDKTHYCFELIIRAINSVLTNKIDEYLNPYEAYMVATGKSFIFKRDK